MRHGLKLLGLCMLAALSLMALSAAAAQASGEFLLGEPLETFAEAGKTEKTIEGSVEAGELLEEGEIKIHCSGGTGSGKVFKGGTAQAEALFNECTVLENKFCHVYEKLGSGGKLEGEGHIFASGSGELLLMTEGGVTKHYLSAESAEFASFDIYGPLCPLDEGESPNHLVIHGSAVVYLPDALQMPALKTHEIQSLTLAESKTLFPSTHLFLGANEAHFGNGTGPGGVVVAHVHLTSNEVWGSK